MMALRALRKSRTDVEAPDLTADRLRRLQDAFAKAGDDSRVRTDRHTAQADAGTVRPDDQQAHLTTTRTTPQPGSQPLSAPDGSAPGAPAAFWAGKPSRFAARQSWGRARPTRGLHQVEDAELVQDEEGGAGLGVVGQRGHGEDDQFRDVRQQSR
jgi:hypothetical protein